MLTKLEYQQIVAALESAKHDAELDNGTIDVVVILDAAIRMIGLYVEEDLGEELHRTDR